MKPERIVWRDANATIEDSDTPSDYLVETLGWVLEEGPVFLKVASEKLPDGGWRFLSWIPLENVKRRVAIASSG